MICKFIGEDNNFFNFERSVLYKITPEVSGYKIAVAIKKTCYSYGEDRGETIYRTYDTFEKLFKDWLICDANIFEVWDEYNRIYHGYGEEDE